MPWPDSDNAIPQSIVDIDARLLALEQEKNELLTFREHLQKSSQSPPVSDSYSTEQKIQVFRNLFRGRSDIFANRWQNQQGRSGYSVACNNEWGKGICHKPRVKCQDCSHRQFTEINDQLIYRHLTGQQVVGLYPLMHDNTCYFLAADFDKGQWQEEVQAMSQACANFGIPHAIEISRLGNGAHLWIFFKNKVPAKEARLLAFGLLDKAMDVLTNLSFDSYDRLLPNQDILPEGGFGNLIALPLQREARLAGNRDFQNASNLGFFVGSVREGIGAMQTDAQEQADTLNTIFGIGLGMTGLAVPGGQTLAKAALVLAKPLSTNIINSVTSDLAGGNTSLGDAIEQLALPEKVYSSDVTGPFGDAIDAVVRN